jgi:hypothetical protein
MSQSFETVATFGTLAEASMARNRLAAEGIDATLDGEELVAMNWTLTGAVGGIKLRVAKSDVDRALSALGDPVDAASLDWDDPTLPVEGESVRQSATTAAPDEPPSAREQTADRAWRGAIVGLLLPPLQIYVFYLVFAVYLSNEPLRDRYRLRALGAAAINFPLVIVGALFVRHILF